MIELPDDELDKLFRKSSEELDPTYEPDDWNDLRKRLDQQDGKTPAGWWRKWWPLGVLALLIPAGIALYSWYAGKKEGSGLKTEVLAREDGEGRMEDGGRENGVAEESKGGKDEGGKDEGGKDEGVTEEGGTGNGRLEGAGEKGRGKSGTLNADSEVGPVGVSGGKNAAEKPVTNIKETGKSFSKSDASAAGNAGSRLLPRSQSKTGGVYLEPNRSKVGGGDGAFSISNRSKTNTAVAAGQHTTGQATDAQAANSSEKTVGGNESSDRIGTEAADNATAQPETSTRTGITAVALSSRALNWHEMRLPLVVAPEQPEVKTEIAKPPVTFPDEQPLVAFRFGYSPDLSTVGLKNFSKPGTAVSLLAEYAVLPGVFLQSGVVWSRKTYYGDASSYELPKIPHYYPPEMTGVDGVCKILEVPVGVRYDIASGRRSRWFAGGGFSSYHMNSEKYKYYFVDENDPSIKYRGWNGKTGWYWFSHANVSAGYEYRISRKLSLMAEPSIRMPLKRVGYGKVNLITTGLWLSVRYTPVFK